MNKSFRDPTIKITNRIAIEELPTFKQSHFYYLRLYIQNSMNEHVLYYKKRANEYEQVYQKPERQKDLVLIKEFLGQQFINKSIVEIACGTGYWTGILSKSAKSVLASDINPEVLEIAQSKNYPKANVIFEIQDIKNLKTISGNYEGLFGGFIWSHIKKEELEEFLKLALNQVREQAELIFLDNKYISGSSLPITRTDKSGNTFQTRELMSGEKFEILKNFPHYNDLKILVEKIGDCFEWIDFDHYWIIKFKKRNI